MMLLAMITVLENEMIELQQQKIELSHVIFEFPE